MIPNEPAAGPGYRRPGPPREARYRSGPRAFRGVPYRRWPAPGVASLGLALAGVWVGSLPLLAQSTRSLPVELDDLQLILLPVTESGVTLRLRLDSGGTTVLFTEALQRLGLSPDADLGSGVPLPAFSEGAWIPGLEESETEMDPSRTGQSGTPEVLMPVRIPVRPHEGGWPGLDGVLGVSWLQGRSWTFDYPGRSLLLRTPGDLPLHGQGERMDLLRGDSRGEAMARGGPMEGVSGDSLGIRGDVPVVRVQAGGDSLPAAIHTASRAELTEAAVAAMGDLRATRRAITRVEASLFDAWRTQHPDWRVLEGAEEGTGEPVMEIRALRIASSEIPRLWVVRSGEIGVEVRGGTSGSETVRLFLGGDVLREFRLTLDFVEGVAVIEPAGFP